MLFLGLSSSPLCLIFFSFSIFFYFLLFVVHSLSPGPVQLCDPMDCSTAGPPSFMISWSLLKFMSIESVMLSNHLILCHPFLLLPLSFPASGSSPVNPLFASGGRSIGASALVAVLPVNIQGCFPLGLTDLISLQFRGLSRVFSSTTVLKLQRSHFFSLDINILYRFLIYIYFRTFVLSQYT